MAKQYFMQYPNGNIIQTSNPEYHQTAIQLPAKQGFKAYKEQYKNDVLSWIKPGDTIYGLVRSVSRSGMQRVISFFYIDDNKRLCCLDNAMHVLCGFRQAKGQGVILNGCGMDMIFHGVYCLGQSLWPDGTPEAHGIRNGDTAGGYALKYSSI